jgi:pimeloyl-ACP methyl ester carboxylesterase
MAFPQDFEIPQDQGGPGQGQPIGGFGGHPSRTQDQHRSTLQGVGKAPVILLHGNSGSADSGRWNMLDLQQMLIKAAYPRELIWAPSYLGTGTLDLMTPHTNNVNEVRAFIDNVCQYLDVAVVDIIAHSLGCSLAYAIFRGLKRQTAPIEFDDQLKRWNRVGTFVALAGAFHGLGPSSVGEW